MLIKFASGTSGDEASLLCGFGVRKASESHLRCRPSTALLILAGLLAAAGPTRAAVVVSLIGGKTIDMDTRFQGSAQAFTTIDDPSPQILETAAGEIGNSITIAAPSGWAFHVVAPTAATPLAPSNIVLGAVEVFPFQINIPVITPSTTPGPIVITHIRMQPVGCINPGSYNVPITTDAGGAGDLADATLITVTVRPGPALANYTLTSTSPQNSRTPIAVTISALDSCGFALPSAVVPSDITLSCPVAGDVVWTGSSPFTLSNVNTVPDTATIAAGNVFDATGHGTFSVTNQQFCPEDTTITATYALPIVATTPLSISWLDSGVDSDADGVTECLDLCAKTPACAAASVDASGCPADADSDGLFDGCDNCPGSNDLADADGDGIPDCLDACPTVGDTDGDGVQDCQDGCPTDSLKIAPGGCGCGAADTDADADGVPDCNDDCPNDPSKLSPGSCGCGTPDTDTDGDAVPDCLDPCPADGDTDSDGVQDCQDGCPNDPLKLTPGICSCGAADTDSDGDGVQDCQDRCPTDAAKLEPGVCGCGVPDTDADNDGIPDCLKPVTPSCGLGLQLPLAIILSTFLARTSYRRRSRTGA